MLYEILKVRQIPGEPYRRWFTDTLYDLYVWYADEARREIVGFQFCYDKNRLEHAVTWHKGRGFRFNKVDQGLDDPLGNQSQILRADGRVRREALVMTFHSAAKELDQTMVKAILDVLKTFPE